MTKDVRLVTLYGDPGPGPGVTISWILTEPAAWYHVQVFLREGFC